MAASSSAEGSVHLTVTTGSPLAEVFLIDDQFALVARGIGALDCHVAPGVYKLKAKLGDATTERLVVLKADAVLDVKDELHSGSAVPIEPPQASRTRAWAPPPPPLERDRAQFYLMTRSRPAGKAQAPRPSRARLCRPDGTVVAQLEPSHVDTRATTVVDVTPGAYLLRREDASGDTIEQFVHAVAGWQTQLFALEEPGDDLDLARTRVSVLMARTGFDPHAKELRLVEDARTALADERKVASEPLSALFEETSNPMLGLYGAHLMLIARDAARNDEQRRGAGLIDARRPSAPVQFDQERFDRLVDKLRELLGPGHPDAVALATVRTGQSLEALEPIAAPPMLWRSWVLLIQASNDAPKLVPVETWRRTVHVLPLRPFFLWLAAGESSKAGEAWEQSVARTLDAAARKPEPGSRRTRSFDFGPAPRATAPDAARASLTRQLLVPRAAIDELADR